MTGPGIKTHGIFAFADLCIDAGHFPGFQGKEYVLMLVWAKKAKCIVHREMVNSVLPRPCRVWLCKGKLRRLLGDSYLLPFDLSSGVLPPYIM